MSLRETILNSAPAQATLPKTPVDAFGQSFFVRVMTGFERDAFESAYLESKSRGKPNVRGAMVAFSACDEHGVRIFTDADADALGNMKADELDKVFEAAQKLNAISEDDIKELEGN